MKRVIYMQKKIIILFALVIMLSGCTVVRIDTNDIDNIVNVVLQANSKLYNRIGKGYKYYVPRGVTYIDSNELNDKLYSNGNYYYLFVDAISYYYKIDETYKVNKNAYYSKAINIDGKKGYIEITENGSKYFIEFKYNYSKIEALVAKEDLNEVILDASYILSNITFNDQIIKLMLNDELFTNREEKYNRFEQKKDTGNFLEYEDQEPENK